MPIGASRRRTCRRPWADAAGRNADKGARVGSACQVRENMVLYIITSVEKREEGSKSAVSRVRRLSV